jgi:hypothetical protein
MGEKPTRKPKEEIKTCIGLCNREFVTKEDGTKDIYCSSCDRFIMGNKKNKIGNIKTFEQFISNLPKMIDEPYGGTPCGECNCSVEVCNCGCVKCKEKAGQVRKKIPRVQNYTK